MAEKAGLVGGAFRIDENRQVAAQPHGVHGLEEKRPMAAEQILHVVLRRGDQQIHAGLVHQTIEPRGIEQGIAPFDTTRLDRLMDEAGMDLLVATSKHNVQYLLGGHRAFFFESMDAMGLSRYLPVFVYPKGAPDKAGFFGHRMENYQNEVKPFWVSELDVKSSGSVDVM